MMMWLVGVTCLFAGSVIGFFTAALLAASKRADIAMEHMK